MAMISAIRLTVILAVGTFLNLPILPAQMQPVAAQEATTQLPSGYSRSSPYKIRYDDWDYLLSSIVLNTGRSDRVKPGRAALRQTSSRIRHGNFSATASEGNRIFFHEFEDEHRASILAIRKDLEAVPDLIEFEQFTKEEQLAFWLNLHNVSVLYEVSKAYPLKRVKSLRRGRNSVWDDKTLMVAGVPTSIRDIEEHIVNNWNDPLVLYGLFMGAVGGPNLRDHAYTGENVLQALNDNAEEFVNSLRGFRLWSGRGRVSGHYDLGKQYFPNFDQDIKRHLLKYANDSVRKYVNQVSRFTADSYDWAIADIRNGDVYAGSSFNTSSAGLAWFIQNVPGGGSSGAGVPVSSGVNNSFVSDPFFNIGNIGNIPPQTRAFLRAVRERQRRRLKEGKVTVEEFVGGSAGRIEGPETVEPDSPDEQSIILVL